MGLSSQIAEREDAVLCSDVRGMFSIDFHFFQSKKEREKGKVLKLID